MLTQAYNETAQRMQAEINQQIAHLQQLQQYQLQHLQPQLGQATPAAMSQLLQPMSVSINDLVSPDSSPLSATSSRSGLSSSAYKRSHQYSMVNGNTAGYSPRIAPAVKMAALPGHRILKTSNGTTLSIIADHFADEPDVCTLLTPPRTPICTELVN